LWSYKRRTKGNWGGKKNEGGLSLGVLKVERTKGLGLRARVGGK